MTKLSRTIEQWRNCNPRSMATEQSAVAAEYAFADAKHDILVLHAQREELLKALTRLCKSFPTGDDMHAANWGRHVVDEACNAYDAARSTIRKLSGDAA